MSCHKITKEELQRHKEINAMLKAEKQELQRKAEESARKQEEESKRAVNLVFFLVILAIPILAFLGDIILLAQEPSNATFPFCRFLAVMTVGFAFVVVVFPLCIG